MATQGDAWSIWCSKKLARVIKIHQLLLVSTACGAPTEGSTLMVTGKVSLLVRFWSSVTVAVLTVLAAADSPATTGTLISTVSPAFQTVLVPRSHVIVLGLAALLVTQAASSNGIQKKRRKRHAEVRQHK